jgi:trigger factor
MKVEVKKIDATRRELSFELPKERVAGKLEEVFGEISKVAKVRGYRPGKVPLDIVKKYYHDTAQEEVLKKLIPEAYQEGIQKENIIPLDYPEIDEVSLKEGILRFKAAFDIRPEVTVKDYKQIKVVRKSSQVTEEEINKTLDYFKKGQGKKEDEPVDDAFARGLGYPNLEEFKKFLTRQMELDKDRQNRLDVENQIVEALLKKAKLVVPQSLVNKQLERRVDEMVKRMRSHGAKDEDIKKREDELRKELKEVVEREVKVYFILEKIAQEEKLELKEGENIPAKVMEYLMKEASWEEEKK